MKNKGRLIVSVTGRITIFLYLFTLFILLLYIQGSFQDFLDDSLIKLLVLFEYSSLVFIGFAFSYIITLIIAGKNTGRKIGMRIAVTSIGIIISSVFFMIVQIIMTGLEPIM